MVGFSLNEKWNLGVLARIANLGGQEAKLAAHVLERVDRKTGLLRTDYKHGKNTPKDGRLYAYPSLQNAPGWMRRLCSHQTYHDLDIVNCHLTILEQIARK